MDITLKLSQEHVQTIVNVLAEVPYKISQPVIVAILAQANAPAAPVLTPDEPAAS